MKEHFERHWVKYAFGIVAAAFVIIFWFAYLPQFEHTLSKRNEDWGNFGAFFWGFGTMCFTLLNAIIFYIISQRLYRKQIYDTYRVALDRLTLNLTDKKTIRLNVINIIGFLAGIYKEATYSQDVKSRAIQLMAECSAYLKDPDVSTLPDLLGSLTTYQICLLINEYHEEENVDFNNSDNIEGM